MIYKLNKTLTTGYLHSVVMMITTDLLKLSERDRIKNKRKILEELAKDCESRDHKCSDGQCVCPRQAADYLGLIKTFHFGTNK